MAINLQKGQKVSLAKQDSILKLTVGLGWDVSRVNSVNFDLDAHAYLLNDEGKLHSTKHHVYYANRSFEHAVIHMGDNLTGAGDGDDEQILISLDAIPTDVSRIRFVVKIYEAASRCQSFGQVSNAFIHIDSDTETLCRFNLTDQYADETIMVIGEIYRHGSDWKFNAIGQGFTSEEAFKASMI